MSHEEQTKEGCAYAFRRHLSSRGRRRKACQKTPMQETLQQDKEHGAAAHTQEKERQQRAQEGLRNQRRRAARAARIPSLRTRFGTGSWLARVVSEARSNSFGLRTMRRLDVTRSK
ncbi:unnamed protein product [Sphagnum balticum]